MAGIADPSKLDAAKSIAEAQSACDLPGIKYAREFAECGGRGAKEQESYKVMVKEYGEGRARSLQAICWFLYWGSFTGNTLNGMLGLKKGRESYSPFFKATFCAYYGPLFFGLINTVAFLIKPLPQVPTWFSAAFGVILASIAGCAFFPLGVIGKIIDAKERKSD